MKAITTKFFGPTNFRGSRVKASDGDGQQITLGWEHALSSEENHDRAALALCAKMNWPGKLVRGWIKKGYVYCFIERPNGKFKPIKAHIIEA